MMSFSFCDFSLGNYRILFITKMTIGSEAVVTLPYRARLQLKPGCCMKPVMTSTPWFPPEISLTRYPSYYEVWLCPFPGRILMTKYDIMFR